MIAAVETSLARLRVAYLAPLQRQAGAFWRWWSRELLAVAPAAVQRSVAASNDRAFIQVSGNELVVFRGSIGRMQETTRLPIAKTQDAAAPKTADARQVVLLLPPDAVLDTTVAMPEAVEENLNEVLAFEMDQLTPFTPEQVYYGHEIVSRSPANNTIDVRLLVARRDAVDRLLEGAQQYGIVADVVTTKDEGQTLNDINLLPTRRNSRAADAGRWLQIALAATLLLLLGAACTLPLLQKQRLIAELEPQVTAAMQAAKEGSQLKRSIEAFATGSTELVARKEARLTIIAIVDELSRVLPDDTWLNRIDIAGNEVQVQGQSRSAASLIALVEASPMLSNARFRSPVTQVANADTESFHLSADWSNPQ